MKRIAVLPSMLTTGNVVCGFASITFAAKGLVAQHMAQHVASMEPLSLHYFDAAAWCIMLAMVFDALDGKVARMTNTTSDFGCQLDSLADVITFGLAPAFMVKAMSQGFPPRIGWLISTLFLVCAALRLARFNVETDGDDSAHDYFKGLPTPAAAGMIAALIILHNDLVLKWNTDVIRFLLPLVTLGLAALMISNIPFAHVVTQLFKNPRPMHYFSRLIFLAVFLGLTKEYSLTILFGLYCLSGIVSAIRLPERERQALAGADGEDEEEDAVF